MIKAPYNFVPLSEKVFYPDEWTYDNHKISHDIPFHESKSGEIDILLTAKTSIFIADHQDKEKFCHYNGVEYIPGSSLKGMVRNILEIMSFSKISTEDKKFSYRDIDNQEYKDRLVSKQNNIQCGWLYQENGTWKIIELGDNKKFKVTHEELAELLKNKAVRNFPNLHQRDKTPEKKYKKYNFDFESLKTTDEHIAVFTGTVDPENDKEFKFPIPQKSEDDIVVDDKIAQTFKDAYYIGKPDESKVWKKMWKKVFNEGGFVPIFYLKDNGELLHFGLSLLYKLPYDYSVYDGISKEHQDKKLDMAETIFGFTQKIEDTNYALKGRVQFSHLKIVDKPQNTTIEEVVKILNSPKPTYYPMYIEQDCDNQTLINMNNKSFKISGWKRYIVKDKANHTNDSNANEKVIRKFTPLPKGTKFLGKIRYHNLRSFELGALLSAITLHGNQNILYPNIGMAKPHGFGSVKIDILMESDLYKAAIKAYEEKMQSFLNQEWLSSEQLKELFATMTPIDSSNDYTYQGFAYYGKQKRPINHNRDCKESHSSLMEENIEIKSISSISEDLKNIFEKSKNTICTLQKKELDRENEILKQKEAQQQKEKQAEQNRENAKSKVKNRAKAIGEIYSNLEKNKKKKKKKQK
jgi:CRISPR-associated protein (TIGR03986 family)